MRSPVLRRQPSARSRMLSSTGSARAGRGLGDVVSGVVHGVSGVVHDASDVVHDVGHAVGDVLSGQLSRIPDDLLKTTLDVAKTGKDVVGVVHGALDPSGNNNSGGSGSGSGEQNPGGGGEGAPQPRPPANSGAGGGEGTEPHPSPPDSSQAPSSTTPLASSTSPSSKYTAPAPSTSGKPVPGAMNVVSSPLSGHKLAEPMYPHAQNSAGPTYGQPTNGMQLSSTASDTQSSTTMGSALPSNGSGASTAHRKGFPLAAAAALGAVLGFLVVSALFWAFWLYLRKRRRAFHAVYLPPKRMLSVTTARTVSTVPLFISASEAGVKDDSKNPFRHPLDEDEGDPFDAASLWRSSATRSESTLSV